jgi:hypothetical protein
MLELNALYIKTSGNINVQNTKNNSPMIKRILQYVGMFTSEDPVNSGRSHVI